MKSQTQSIEDYTDSEELDEMIFNIIFERQYMKSIGFSDELFDALSESIKRSWRASKRVNLEKQLKFNHIHHLAIIGRLFIIPIGLFDLILLFAFFACLFSIFLLTAFNIHHLRLLYACTIPQRLLALLHSAKFAMVGTISLGGSPHITPTLFVCDGRSIFIVTSVKSQKVKNLHQTNDIAIFIDSNTNRNFTKSEGVLIRGRTRIYDHNFRTGMTYMLILGFHIFRIYFLFRKKYPCYTAQYLKKNWNLPRDWQILPIISRTIIEIVPEEFFLWKASKPTLVKFWIKAR